MRSRLLSLAVLATGLTLSSIAGAHPPVDAKLEPTDIKLGTARRAIRDSLRKTYGPELTRATRLVLLNARSPYTHTLEFGLMPQKGKTGLVGNSFVSVPKVDPTPKQWRRSGGRAFVEWASKQEPTPPPRFIRDVPAIGHSSSAPPGRGGLKYLVEVPLLSACERLYDKGIFTTYSSANAGNLPVPGIKDAHAYFQLLYSELSVANQRVADQLVERGVAEHLPPSVPGRDTLRVKFPLRDDSTVAEVRAASMKVANRFFDQRK